MKKQLFFLIFIISFSYQAKTQELFVFTEPASNMAKGNIGFRLSNSFMKEKNTGDINVHIFPEIMFGISKKIMIHGEAFVSNRNKSMASEGGSFYMKYRFYSHDEVHSHFRMALFTRMAWNNSEIHQDAIDLNGHNSGVELGTIATKLIHKVAVSSSVSSLFAADNNNQTWMDGAEPDRNAMNYTLSFGKLMLPKEYVNYNQTNLNVMLELLGQTNLTSGKSFLDLAPSVQFIVKSKSRFDVGYRFAVSNYLERTSPNGGFFRFEYNIFNAF